MSQELENVIEGNRTSILVRLKGWQKADLEAEARRQGRSVNNFVLWVLGQRRKWRDLDQETGSAKPAE